jgi:flavin-dependent dehydrogenase
MAGQLKAKGGNLRDYWGSFMLRLKKRGLVNCDDVQPMGYSYFVRDSVDTACVQNAYLVGDAIGLATRDMCEGIGPAIESSLLAAHSIVTGSDYSLAGINSLSGQSFISRHLERKFAGMPVAPGAGV